MRLCPHGFARSECPVNHCINVSRASAERARRRREKREQLGLTHKKCPWCECEFSTTEGQRIYCSRECGRQSQNYQRKLRLRDKPLPQQRYVQGSHCTVCWGLSHRRAKPQCKGCGKAFYDAEIGCDNGGL